MNREFSTNTGVKHSFMLCCKLKANRGKLCKFTLLLITTNFKRKFKGTHNSPNLSFGRGSEYNRCSWGGVARGHHSGQNLLALAQRKGQGRFQVMLEGLSAGLSLPLDHPGRTNWTKWKGKGNSREVCAPATQLWVTGTGWRDHSFFIDYRIMNSVIETS